MPWTYNGRVLIGECATLRRQSAPIQQKDWKLRQQKVLPMSSDFFVTYLPGRSVGAPASALCRGPDFVAEGQVAVLSKDAWHGYDCDRNFSPKTNARAWRDKIERNWLRDRQVARAPTARLVRDAHLGVQSGCRAPPWPRRVRPILALLVVMSKITQHNEQKAGTVPTSVHRRTGCRLNRFASLSSP